MKRKLAEPQKPKGPWADRLGEDARALLRKLEAQNWNPAHALSLLRGPLGEVISSVEFNTQHRWGLQVDSEEIRHLSKEFLQWMTTTGRWEDWKVVAKELSGTWPLRFFLARYYLRFVVETRSKEPFIRGASKSAQRAFLDLNRGGDIGETLSQQMLEAFSGVTQKLPKEERLIYEMHLEGLLNHEIAWILAVSEDAVQDGIAKAKEFLLDFASGGEPRRERS